MSMYLTDEMLASRKERRGDDAGLSARSEDCRHAFSPSLSEAWSV
ncbi:MAG: hypothetical protein ACLTXL_13110 [Clostridia bacterium]